jgi:hypothetical protein
VMSAVGSRGPCSQQCTGRDLASESAIPGSAGDLKVVLLPGEAKTWQNRWP